MTKTRMTDEQKRIRLFVYEFVLQFDRCPTLNEIAEQAGLTPLATQDVLERLEDYSAIVLSPRSPNLWLVDPFAALPTPYPVIAGEHRWYGMCVWDALGILALAGADGRAPTRCPVSGVELELRVDRGVLAPTTAIVHFAVPAADWWKHLGFT